MKNLYKRVFITLTALIIAGATLLTLTGCKKEENVIKIGAILPLTGGAAFLGKPEQNVLKMWEETINSEGGIKGQKVKIFFEDSKTSPKDGLSAFHKLLAQGIKFYITSLTMVALTTQPVAEKEKVVQIALSMHPTIASKSKYTFRVYYGIETELEEIAKFIKGNGGKRVAILYINTAEMAAGVDEIVPKIFQKYGLELVAAEPYEFNAKDIRPQFSKITGLNPDYTIVEDYGTVVVNIIREAQKFGVKDRLIGGIGFTGIAPEFRKLAEGIPFVVPTPVVQKPEAYIRFIQNYKEKFGEEPLSPIDEIYTVDALKILLKAIEKVGYNPQKVAEIIPQLSPYKGAIGEIRITSEGNAIFEASLATFKSGEVIPYQSINKDEK